MPDPRKDRKIYTHVIDSLSRDELRRLAGYHPPVQLAWRQILAKGKVTPEELMHLEGEAPGVLRAIATAKGIEPPQVLQMALTVEDVEAALQHFVEDEEKS